MSLSKSRLASDRPMVMYVLTSSLGIRFLRGQLRFLHQAGYEVTVVSSPGEELKQIAESEPVQAVAVELRREISPLRDVIALWSLWRLMLRLRPTITNVGTPKAGLLGGLAAVFAGVPCRIYTLHGLRCETAKGARGRLLLVAEKLACWSAHKVISVSASLRSKAISLRLVSSERIKVIHSGSCGIDYAQFDAARSPSESLKCRKELGIPECAPVLGFVGRFTRDKGIAELLTAFATLQSQFDQLRLLLVGDFEEGDPPSGGVRKQIETDPNIVTTGLVPDASHYYGAMDVLVLPTYREGLPTVVLEAHASGKPVVTTCATGAVDSVIDGVNGFIVPIGDSAELARAVARLFGDPQLARRIGRAGQERVKREFQKERIWAGLEAEYRLLLKEKGRHLPWFKQVRACFGFLMRQLLKRTLDIMFSVTALVLLAPAMMVIAILIWSTMGRPILFRQRRAGYQGKPFTIFKFRTMADLCDAGGRPLPDDARLTTVGIFLRRFSLDELPQLWNVFVGGMSLVGPRPLLVDYLPRYSPEQARRHEMKPGITGWAQVNGRNALTWDQKFKLDVWYVDHACLGLDGKILARTIWSALSCKAINQTGQGTTEEFLGVRTQITD